MKKIKRKKTRVGKILRSSLCTLSFTFGSLCTLSFTNNCKMSMVCDIYLSTTGWLQFCWAQLNCGLTWSGLAVFDYALLGLSLYVSSGT